MASSGKYIILTYLAMAMSVSWGYLVEDQDFVWGTATAAYQVEGSREADEREPSLWDAFDTQGVSTYVPFDKPNGVTNIYDAENAAVCDDDYFRYNESAILTGSYGFGAARMSVSWTRVMSSSLGVDGRVVFTPNAAGIAHYKEVMQVYLDQSVRIALTMFHWDLPLSLEEMASDDPDHCPGKNSSAWLCDWMPGYFEEYAQLLLTEFSPYVSWWITINEPLTILENGYAGGSHAPGRCSDTTSCWHGDSTTEPYLSAKYMILAHAKAFRAWEAIGSPGEGCGVTLNGDYRVPFTDSQEDLDAAVRSMEFEVAIFADPIHLGAWPQSIVDAVGDRLPVWTPEELTLVYGSHDGNFFMNTYTSNFARATDDNDSCGYFCDAHAESSGYNFTSGKPIGTPSSNGWLFNYGPGIGNLVDWYNTRWPGLTYILTENGWGNETQTEALDVVDLERCNFYRDYIGNLSKTAAEKNIQVGAYFAWSLMDNYEWTDGFSTRFGLTYVDYDTQNRVPKLSAKWFQEYITPLRTLPTDGQPLPECSTDLMD